MINLYFMDDALDTCATAIEQKAQLLQQHYRRRGNNITKGEEAEVDKYTSVGDNYGDLIMVSFILNTTGNNLYSIKYLEIKSSLL